MKKMSIFFLGLVAGLLVGWLTMWTTLPSMLITVYESKLTFEDTVDSIQTAAAATGWQIPKVYDIEQSLVEAGQGDVDKVKVISLCNPALAYSLLRNDADRSLSALIPCRIGVYVTSDGRVWVTSMNTSLLSKMFDGPGDSVLSEVASGEHDIIKDIVIP